MRLLFDQNLSPRLKDRLQDLYPDSKHVRDAGLGSAADFAVWAYAKEHDFVITSKDAGFRQLSFAFGHPPKVVWVRRGNCSTSQIESILRDHYSEILAFYRREEGSFFAIT